MKNRIFSQRNTLKNCRSLFFPGQFPCYSLYTLFFTNKTLYGSVNASTKRMNHRRGGAPAWCLMFRGQCGAWVSSDRAGGMAWFGCNEHTISKAAVVQQITAWAGLVRRFHGNFHRRRCHSAACCRAKSELATKEGQVATTAALRPADPREMQTAPPPPHCHPASECKDAQPCRL